VTGELERRADAFPTVGEVEVGPLDPSEADPVVALPRAAVVSARRARWLSAQLAEQVEREGVTALVTREMAIDRDGLAVATGREHLSGLAVLEAQERDRAERGQREMVKLRLQAATLERQAETVALLVGGMRRFAEALGADWSSPEIRRMVQAAVLEAKAQAERGTT
jgi:hypothetical protein